MTRFVAVAAGLVMLAAPSAASAASLTVSPQKRCYSSGETVTLDGTGFSPGGTATITRDGTPLNPPLTTTDTGAFSAFLTLGQNSGRKTRTYTATDNSAPTLTASAQITVSAVRVNLSPTDGAPGRRMRIDAHGFTTGTTLWAHVVRKRSKRNVKIGSLKGACGGLKTRRRLLPANAALGVYTIQFDTFRRYNPKQPVLDRYTINVRRG
jgi:hypothetical protein